MEQVQTWMTDNSISITGSMSLSVDQMGYVKEFTTAETLTGPQIASFEETFFNKRLQGHMGEEIASSQTITLTQGNLFNIAQTDTISYITTTEWRNGSVICLNFLEGNITLTHNTGNVPANTAAMFLDSGSNGVFTAGSVLTLIYDGIYWREISRMII